jgi:hypothetical protein
VLKHQPRQRSLARVGSHLDTSQAKAQEAPPAPELGSPPVTRRPFHRNLDSVGPVARPELPVRCADLGLAFAIASSLDPVPFNGGLLLLTRYLAASLLHALLIALAAPLFILRTLKGLWLCEQTVCAVLPVKRRRNPIHTVA